MSPTLTWWTSFRPVTRYPTSPASSFGTGVASGAKTPASSASESIALAMNRTFEREGSTPSFTRR